MRPVLSNVPKGNPWNLKNVSAKQPIKRVEHHALPQLTREQKPGCLLFDGKNDPVYRMADVRMDPGEERWYEMKQNAWMYAKYRWRDVPWQRLTALGLISTGFIIDYMANHYWAEWDGAHFIKNDWYNIYFRFYKFPMYYEYFKNKIDDLWYDIMYDRHH